MGNQQSKWKRRAQSPFFNSCPYVPLVSSPPSSEAQPLIDPYGPLEANYPQLATFAHGKIAEDHKGDIEALSQKILELEKKVNELVQMVNQLQLRQPKAMHVKDHGADIQKIHEKHSTLEWEINKMKERVIMLEVCSINGPMGNGINVVESKANQWQSEIMPSHSTATNGTVGNGINVAMTGEQSSIMESKANQLQLGVMPSGSTATIGIEEIERQMTIPFEEDLHAGFIIVIFLISVLIGMLIE